MKISLAHVAIWCKDLETMRQFYEKYFNGKSSNLYINKNRMFQSYFIEFAGNTRIELMHKPNIAELPISTNVQHFGLAHLALGVDSKETLEDLTDRLRKDGYYIAGEPRTTGDGYYESVILDPENNIVEISYK
jgi:lactoylglutathione lyase